MSRIATLLSLMMLTLASGCSMCGSKFDYHYAAFGGARQRADRIHGRVGSAFHNAEGVGSIPEELGLAPEYQMLGPPVEGEYSEGDFGEGDFSEGDFSEGDFWEGGTAPSGQSNAPLVPDPVLESERMEQAPDSQVVDPALDPALDLFPAPGF